MNRLAQMDREEIKRFIYDRVIKHPAFRAVIAVSVEKYSAEYSAVVWIGQEPDSAMRHFAYDLEAELENLGVHCSILVKSDRELSLGGVHTLTTARGDFSYRYYKLDPVRDEDQVFGFAVFRGNEMFRFRLSLTGTLASMLRNRGRFDEGRLLEIYKDWIRERLNRNEAVAGELKEQMFNSKHIGLFARGQ